MKKYQSPSLKKALFRAEDVIAVSGDVTNIVSSADAEGSSETQVSSWNDSWN
jgi:hypothetical protein